MKKITNNCNIIIKDSDKNNKINFKINEKNIEKNLNEIVYK